MENAASDDLEIASLTLTKDFTDDPVLAGGTANLRFTLTNASTVNATGIMFTDDLATVLPGSPDLSVTTMLPLSACGGMLDNDLGPTFLRFTGGSVSASTSCDIDVTVMVPAGTADGTYINVTSATSSNLGTGDPASGELIVDSNLLALTKEFTDDPVAPGGTVTLEFTLENLDLDDTASAIAFMDDLSAALSGLTATTVSTNTCGFTVGGLGTGMLSMTDGTLGGGASCTLSFSVTVPGMASVGVATNTTSGVTGTILGVPATGDPASDDLLIETVVFTKAFDGLTTAAGTPMLTFTISNLDTFSSVTLVSFSDDLDAVIMGLEATSLPTNPCGTGSTLAGTSFLTLTGGTLAAAGMAGDSCMFSIPLLVPGMATAGSFPNTTSDLFESGLPVAAAATDTLTVEPPPIFAKSFAPDFIGLGLTSTLTFSIDNSASALAASSLAFSDTLPAGILVAATPGVSNTCGGTVTALAGTGVINLSGGTVGAGATCVIMVTVQGTATGAHLNTTGDLTSSSGNSGTASDTLTVNPQPGFSKTFSADPIAQGGTSTLTFTIDNTGSTVAAASLDFTDNLPAAVVIATPSNATTTCTGGTLTAPNGGSSISYSSGTVSAGASCTVTVDVTSSTPGSHLNTSGNLTSSLGTSGSASDTLTVNPPPAFSKDFSPNPIAPGATSRLTFTIDISGSSVDATSLDFGDTLPMDVVIDTPSNAATTCTGGTLTAPDGGSIIGYTGGSVSAGASCTVSVDVTSDVPGTHSNVSGDLTSNLGNSGTAADDLMVNALLGQLGATKVPDSTTVVQGSRVTFTITIDNLGLNNLLNIFVDDPLTPDCDRAVSSLDDLGPGESLSYTCETDPLDVTFTNEVTITADLGNPPNGLSTLTGPVQVVAVATATVVVTPSDKVPTLSDLGLLILLLLLGGTGYFVLRRRLEG